MLPAFLVMFAVLFAMSPAFWVMFAVLFAILSAFFVILAVLFAILSAFLLIFAVLFAILPAFFVIFTVLFAILSPFFETCEATAYNWLPLMASVEVAEILPAPTLTIWRVKSFPTETTAVPSVPAKPE